jgi:hypothetical protein
MAGSSLIKSGQDEKKPEATPNFLSAPDSETYAARLGLIGDNELAVSSPSTGTTGTIARTATHKLSIE